MPFDDFGFVVEVRKFDDLNLVPISEERAEQWRMHVIRAFRGRRAFPTMAEFDRSRWLSTRTFPVECFGKRHKIGARAPKDVRNLAALIATALPDATCSVDYFDTDPILYIHHNDKRHCVAIWDKGVVRAIAGNAQLSRLQRGLRRISATV